MVDKKLLTVTLILMIAGAGIIYLTIFESKQNVTSYYSGKMFTGNSQEYYSNKLNLAPSEQLLVVSLFGSVEFLIPSRDLSFVNNSNANNYSVPPQNVIMAYNQYKVTTIYGGLNGTYYIIDFGVWNSPSYYEIQKPTIFSNLAYEFVFVLIGGGILVAGFIILLREITS